MERLVIILLSILSFNVLAWESMVPLAYCPAFQIEFKYEGTYQIRYKQEPDSERYTHIKKGLHDINNLSTLTDELSYLAEKYCPLEYTVNFGNDSITCVRELDTNPFSDEYINMLKEIIGAVDDRGKNCKDMIPTIQLQQKISSIEPEELINFSKYRSLIKIFTGNATDEVIDHFYECGGQNGSKQFVENMIMLELKNACFYPAPPGIMSFERSLAIAKKISDRYPKMGLIKLNSNQNALTKDAIITYTKEILSDQLKDFLGPNFKPDRFISELKLVKDLEDVNPSKSLEHLSTITVVDAPLEMVDKVLPMLVQKNYSELLADTIPTAQRNKFINDIVYPKIKAKYDQCIAPIKKRVKYPFEGDKSNLVSYRKGLQKKFCEANEEKCNASGCDSVKNFMTDRSDIGDMDVVQACVFSSLTTSIKPMLDKFIKAQRHIFEKHLPVDDKKMDLISDDAYKLMMSCVDRKIKKEAGKNYKEPITSNIEAYYHIDANQYRKSLEQCSEEVENNHASQFMGLVIARMDVTKDTYGNGKKSTKFGIPVDRGSLKFADQIVTETVPRCVRLQRIRRHNQPEQKVSAVHCQPVLEIEASERLISENLSGIISEYNLNGGDKIISDYKRCNELAKSDAYSALLNPKHDTPIMNSSDSENFLANNHKYYKCLESTVLKLADNVSDIQLDVAIESVSDQLSDKKYIKDLRSQIKSKISRCFKTEMNKVGSWPKFIKFHEDDGLERVTKKCTDAATNYTLPLVVANETKIKLETLKSPQLMSSEDIDSIMNDIATDLEIRLKLKVPSNIKENRNAYVIDKAFKQFKRNNPNSKDPINDFINQYTKIAQYSTVSKLNETIVGSVVALSKPQYDFSQFSSELNNKCLDQMFEYNKQHIERLAELGKKRSNEMDDTNLKKLFIDIIQKGLIRSHESGRYQELLRKIKNLCSNPSNYKDLKKLVELGITDDFLVGQIEIKVHEAFKDNMRMQCHDDMRNLFGGKLSEAQGNIVQSLCFDEYKNDKERSDALRAAQAMTSDRKEINLLNIIFNRKNKSVAHLEKKLKDKSYIDKLFYKDKTLLNYIYKNFEAIATKDPKTMNEVSLVALDKLFEDKSKSGFAYEFTKSQVIGGIGISGYDKGRKQVQATIQDIGYTPQFILNHIERNAMDSFHSRWDYDGIEHYLAFDKTKPEKSNQIIQQVYQYAIRDVVDTSKAKPDSSILNTTIENHLKENRVYPNPNYKPEVIDVSYYGGSFNISPEEGPQYLNFEEKLAQDIEVDVWNAYNPLD